MRRRSTLGVVLALALAFAVAGPARAQVGPNDPLPGSTFQGGDGNQDDQGALIDWETLQEESRVQHNGDANGADTSFGQGSEENNPGDWNLGTGRVQDAENIVDAWSSVDQPGASTFVYLAAARETATGTSFVAFELNRDSRLWNNGNDDIPCRRTGDIQVAYKFQGNDYEVVLRRWRTTESAARGCASQGCWRATDVPCSQSDTGSPDLGDNAQAAVNAGTIANHLPGFYDASIPARRFDEASLNIAELMDIVFGDDCLAFASIWMHSRSSLSENAELKDYVAPQPLRVRTCAASGVKFFDSDADGERDDGEPGIPRFLIWADYNDDGIRQANEPFSVSDQQGQYVIFDIEPPDETYTLREQIVPGRSRRRLISPGWRCSFPGPMTPGGTVTAPGGEFSCGWPINAGTTPNATGRDFGDWFPARLTIEKELAPEDDPGRFDLFVDDEVALRGAGNGSQVTVHVPPGIYDVSERAAEGTNLADFESEVDCRPNVSRRGTSRPGPVWEGLPLSAGDEASCVFFNIRRGPGPPVPQPLISMRKTGPQVANAGDTLEYSFWVTNRGDVAFAEADVAVTDPACDRPPRRVSTEGDPTPGTLDPDDTWRYRCSRETASGGDSCEPSRVRNTATVSATAGDETVTDEDSISTILLCGPRPSPPPAPVVPIDPDQPGPVAPAGPRPPQAGAAGVAARLFRLATAGCIRSRVPRVAFAGTRIARVRVFVNGALIRNITVETLQRRVRPRVTLDPGRYRIVARVTFERGSATAPVTLRGFIRICGPTRKGADFRATQRRTRAS